MSKTKCKYMHTMDGRPATFESKGGGICVPANMVTLVDDLRTLRKQQEKSKAYDKVNGASFEYSYIRVRVDK